MVDAEEIADRIATVVSNLVAMYLFVSMLGDLLGINIWAQLPRLVTKPWAIPKEWIYQYWYVWLSMKWFVFFTFIADWALFNIKWNRRGRMPPLAYARILSILTFIPSFWLALLFRSYYVIIAVASAIAVAYTVFMGEEAERISKMIEEEMSRSQPSVEISFIKRRE